MDIAAGTLTQTSAIGALILRLIVVFGANLFCYLCYLLFALVSTACNADLRVR
jgi:hypothetical protein